MEDFETALRLGDASTSSTNIPKELGFEEVIKNRTAPPCSLNDFMDYLVYVEHNAECLQFFLWYYDYIQRWSNLLPRQKALSPVWDPEKSHEPASRFITYSHRRARSQKMNKIITIMEMESSSSLPLPENPFEDPPESRPRTPPSALLSPTESTKGDFQPFTIQPFRDELSRIVRLYITSPSPRQLPLSQRDRESCLRAAQHTTHPSALLPALLHAEASLRLNSHPSFIRHSTSNANLPRLVFLRCLGILLILAGLAVDIILILSRQSNFLRILCLVLWWPGLTILIAAWRRLCVVLHFHGERQLRPWELAEDEVEEKRHVRKGSVSSLGADPLRKKSLQTFGPANEFDDEAWVGVYERQGWCERVMGETTGVRNGALRLVQDRTVFFAVLWGGLVASLLTVASLFVPKGDLFL
ncbi:hypothetical protein OQA88_12419 [Cercophora sp. LCS_1]